MERETLLTWLVPNYFGTPLTSTFGTLEYLNYNETMGYAGLGIVALAAISLVAFRRPGWLGLAAVTIVAFGLAYGLPLLTELRWLPGLRQAANTRFVFIAAFGVVCLAGMGLDSCWRSPRRWPALAAAGLLLLVAVVMAGLALFPGVLAPTVGDAAPLTPLDAARWRQDQLWKSAVLAGVWGCGLALLAAGRLKGRAGGAASTLASIAVLGTLAADLMLFGARYNPVLPPDVLRKVPPALGFIQGQSADDRVIGLGEALLPNAATLFGIADFRVYEPIAHRRFLPFFERLDPFLEHDIRSRFYLFVWNPNLDLLRVAGVRWILASR
jgi:hypothetical protein